MNARKLQTAYSVFIALITLLVGALFVVQLADIYFVPAAAEPFSREIVGAHLRTLVAPVCVWLVAIVGGVIFSAVCGEERTKIKVPVSTAYARLRAKVPAGEGEAFLSERRKVRLYERIRLGVRLFALLFAVVAAVMTAVYVFDSSNYLYETDFNTVVIALLQNVMPWIGAAFFVFVGVAVFEYFGTKRTLPALKRVVVLGRGYPVETPSDFVRLKERVIAAVQAPSAIAVNVLRAAVGAVAVVFIILGALNGDARAVLDKAVMICTECIGLG